MMNTEWSRSDSSFIIQHSSFVLSFVKQCKRLGLDLLLPRAHLDLPKRLALSQRDAAEADELEGGEEDGDELLAAAAFEEPGQAHRRALAHFLIELGHLVRDLVHDALQLDRLRVRFLVAVERGAEGVDEVE